MGSIVQELGLACHLSAWRKEYETGFMEISELGFRACEVGSDAILKYKAKVSEWSFILNKAGINISSVFDFGFFSNRMKSREILFHHDSIARLMRKMELNSITLEPGLRLPRYEEKEGRLHVLRMIDETAKRYEAQGVQVCVHPHIGSCIFSRDDIDYYLENTSTNIGIVVDIGHMTAAKIDIFKLLADYSSRIRFIHLKDVMYKGVQHLKFCELGEGDLDLKSLLYVLTDKSNDWTCTLEIENPSHQAAVSIAGCVHFLEGIFRK